MKIYLAGTSVSIPKNEPTIQLCFKNGHKLHSYYHCVDGFENKWFMKNKTNKVDLFLDSGAFSAWSQGEEIDIQEYISFIKKNEKHINLYSNLDVIGNAAATWENQKIMEKAGTNPVPVFHYGEDIKWLKKLLRKKYEYISLGGMVPISTKDLIPWLDDLWANYLTDEKGMPVCKVHGFGLTALRLMLRYPWYSVDSTSWVVTGRMGSVYIPRFKNGKWVYDEDSWKIAVSNQSPSKKDLNQHYETLPPLQQRILMEYISFKGYKMGKSKFKTKPQDYQLKENEKWAEKKPKDKTALRRVEVIIEEGISNKYQLRDELNIIYFLDLEKSIQKWPWAFKKQKTNKTFF